jgi:nucleotide-binding universal stress UspA family protein
VRKLVREGKPFVELIRLARAESVDLIIIPTHGRKGIPHLLIGSTAERVASKASCPVLVLRDREREFVMP